MLENLTAATIPQIIILNLRTLLAIILTEFFIFGGNSSMALIDPTKDLVPFDMSRAGETAPIKIHVSRLRDWLTGGTPEGIALKSFLRGSHTIASWEENMQPCLGLSPGGVCFTKKMCPYQHMKEYQPVSLGLMQMERYWGTVKSIVMTNQAKYE